MMKSQYEVIGTVSGTGVKRANGDIAEFLDRDDAIEACDFLSRCQRDEEDYEWTSRSSGGTPS